MRSNTRIGITGLLVATLLLAYAGQVAAQCPPGPACTEHLGEKKGGHFRILVPDPWDGDVVIVNHGFELDKFTLTCHNCCQHPNPNLPRPVCDTDADCTGFGPETCNKISLFGFEDILLADGKAVAAGTYSQTGWSVFRSRKDLKAIVKFMKKEIGKPSRVIVTGFSMGGAVTADAMVRLKAGKLIHGAVPLCGCVGGGLPSWDTATDVRMVYDHICSSVPGAAFPGQPDVGQAPSGDLAAATVSMALKMNECFGVIFSDPDPLEALAQQARLDDFVALTEFSGTTSGASADILTVGGYVLLGMGDFVQDTKRLRGKRIGWNEGLDYSSMGTDPVLAADLDANIARLSPGKGRKKLNKNTLIDFVNKKGAKVDYPIGSFAGNDDYVCIPEFQKVLSDSAAAGGKEFEQVWGSTTGHCQYTPFEVEAVIREYLDWLDTFGLPGEDRMSTADTEARCLALPGATVLDCNFDTGFTPPALNTRVPARADWPDPAQNPLP